MSIHLNQGDELENRYRLKELILSNELTDHWLAQDEKIGESVRLVIFKTRLSDSDKQTLTSVLSRQQGLLHNKILRIYDLSNSGDDDFYTSQLLDPKGGQEFYFSNEGSFENQWKFLRQLVETLEYLHSLGFCHGLLTPENLAVKDKAIFLAHIGFAAWVTGPESEYLSPQIKQGDTPCPADDIFSLGQLLHKALTGKFYQSADKGADNSDLPIAVKPILSSMLDPEADKRPSNLSDLCRSLDEYLTTKLGNTKIEKTEPAAPAKLSKRQRTTKTNHMLPRDRNTIAGQWVLSGLLILVILIVAVFFYLPAPEPEPLVTKLAPTKMVPPSLTGESVQAPPALAPFAAAKLKQLISDGEVAAEKLLHLQIKLEDKGGTVWAAEQYRNAVAAGLAGDAAYAEAQYQSALDFYLESIKILEQSINRVDEVFKRNFSLGTAALSRGDAKQAIEAFTILATIRPQDLGIKDGLRRAENLDAVQALMARGSIHERDGELEPALKTYRQAQSLDAGWLAASDSIKRINQQLADRRFNAEMSDGFRALNQQEHNEARLFFEAAQQLRPNSSAPKDGLEQIFVLANKQRIDQHRTLATGHLEAEQWQEAIDEFDEILSIAEGTRFAQQAKSQAEDQLSLKAQLERFITNPALMMSDSGLGEAKKLLLRASRVIPRGRFLSDQINRLSHSVSQARISVQLNLNSDNKTHVTIYKVGDYGLFDRKSVTLIPGLYTMVGKRRGYRDVTVELRLKGGEGAQSISINCDERI